MSSKLFTQWLISTLLTARLSAPHSSVASLVEVMATKYEGAYAEIIARNDSRVRIAATKVRKLARASTFPPAVPVIPLAGRA